MLRDKNLVPLSRQHQHALALCVRIHRAALSTPAELKVWQSEVQQHFDEEIHAHFIAEETHIFPAARRHPELSPLVDELLAEHRQLRHGFAQARARALDRAALRKFAEALSAHIRKEERRLFEGLQAKMTTEELRGVGERIQEVLAQTPRACIVPTETALKNSNR